MDSCEEVGEGNALCETGSHLLLGIDGTDVADRCRMAALQGEIPNGIQRYPERIGDHLYKSTASSRALIIHHKIDNLPRDVDLYSFYILSADIADRPGFLKEMDNPPRMAGDLRELFVGKRAVNSSVACSDNEGDFMNRQGGLFQRFFHHPVS